MDRLEHLLIRQEIEELNAEFAYRVDHRLGEQVAELFTPDGSYGRTTGQRSVGRDAIRQAYSLRKEHGTRTARHMFTNLRLVYQGDGVVHGTSIMLLFAEDGLPPLPAQPLAVSDFEDVYVRDGDGAWRYQSRTIRSLFRDASGRPVVLPLAAAGAHHQETPL